MEGSALRGPDSTFFLFLYDSGCKEVDCGITELFLALWLPILMYSVDTKSFYALKHMTA